MLWTASRGSTPLLGRAPKGATWPLAMTKVEHLLAAQGPGVARDAHFVCTLALAWPDGDTAVFEGRVRRARWSGHRAATAASATTPFSSPTA